MNEERKIFKSLRPSILYIKEKLGKDLVGAEIGVYMGDNAEFMLQLLNPRTLYLIDPWNNFMDNNSSEIIGETQYIQTTKRLKQYDNKRIIKKTSLEASKLFNNEELDFVYIDGDHNYSGVKQDIEIWYPKIKKGGILSGHDYDESTEGVVRAVKEFCGKNRISFNTSSTDWWFIK